jgi:arylsulfatase A-like enzyme
MGNTPDRPNILFLFTDDQRFDTLHALGNDQIHTPHMDALAQQGVAFTHAHIMGGTSGAVCMPSRAMLMTGRTLFHLEGAGEGIPTEHTLLGEWLQRHGYHTWGAGKWHNGPASYARSFCSGAEIFFGGMEDHWNVPACHYDPTGRYESMLPVCPDPYRSNDVVHKRGDHVTAGKHSSELFGEAAIQALAEYDGAAPFFLYIAFMAPHDPRTMPRQYLEMYDPDEIELPPNWAPRHPFDNGDLGVRDELLAALPRTPQETRRHIAEYYAMITHLDAQIGRVLEALRAGGHAENTLVVLAGDNGLALGQHGLMGKQNLYDHSVRVPLVLSGPGVPQGRRSGAHAYLSDIYPTLCELAGLPTPETVEGRSLVPALRDAGQPVRESLYCAYRQFQRSVRDYRFKLIEYVVQGRRATQLFDLLADPWETANLAGDPAHAPILAHLRAELLRWRDALDDRASAWGQAFWEGYEATHESATPTG